MIAVAVLRGLCWGVVRGRMGSGLGTWRTQVVFCTPVALVPLPLFFRFVVLV
jgi:hypothetical protein